MGVTLRRVGGNVEVRVDSPWPSLLLAWLRTGEITQRVFDRAAEELGVSPPPSHTTIDSSLYPHRGLDTNDVGGELVDITPVMGTEAGRGTR